MTDRLCIGTRDCYGFRVIRLEGLAEDGERQQQPPPDRAALVSECKDMERQIKIMHSTCKCWGCRFSLNEVRRTPAAVSPRISTIVPMTHVEFCVERIVGKSMKFPSRFTQE